MTQLLFCSLFGDFCTLN